MEEQNTSRGVPKEPVLNACERYMNLCFRIGRLRSDDFAGTEK